MILALPQLKEHREQRLLCLRLEPRELPLLPRLWFHWTHYPETDEFLIHASSAIFVTPLRIFRGFADRDTQLWLRDYYRECRKTFTAEKMTPDGYDWMKHLTRECVPRAYQFAGMDRAYARIVRWGSGIMLADDVGLGKTVQAIGLMSRFFAEGRCSVDRPAIVITQSSLKGQWCDEIERFARPGLSTSNVDGGRADRLERLRPGSCVYVLNYEMNRLPQYTDGIEPLYARASAAFLDETAAVANPSAKTTLETRRLLRDVPAIVTFNATPIENGLRDFFSHTRFLDPNVIGPEESFERRYVVRDFMGKIIRYTKLAEFKKRSAMLYIRRTRDEAGVEMPDVIPQARPVSLSPAHAAVYREKVREYVSDNSTGAVAMAKMAEVQYTAFAQDITDPGSPSAKLDDLETLLNGELSGERVLVFSRFKTVVRFAAARLSRFHPAVISGGVSNRERNQIVREFGTRAGAGRVLLGTDAMTRGLNLQAAGVVVNLDLPWNPARLRQRIGRVRRIGQERKKVVVLNSIATIGKKPTIDHYFLNTILAPKLDLIQKMFGTDDVDEIGDEHIDIAAVRAFLKGAV